MLAKKAEDAGRLFERAPGDFYSVMKGIIDVQRVLVPNCWTSMDRYTGLSKAGSSRRHYVPSLSRADRLREESLFSKEATRDSSTGQPGIFGLFYWVTSVLH